MAEKDRPSPAHKDRGGGRRTAVLRSGVAPGARVRVERGGYVAHTYGAAEHVRRRSGLDPDAMAAFLGISPRTYARRSAQGDLHGDESFKVSMLAHVLDEATRVLGSEDEARHWLFTAIVSLDRRRPIEHLTSIEGYERVKNTLAKIEYGMY